MTPLVFDTAVNASGFTTGMAKIEGIAGKTGSRLSSIFAGPMAALTGALSVGGIVALGKGFLDAGAEMETFETRLGTLMGSTSEAKARMQELYQFAATTPFNTAQVVGAEVTLRGFGASATDIMPGLIDLAAVMGMDLPQAAIDMGKAWNQGAAGMESDGAKVLRTMMAQRAGIDLTKMKIEDFRKLLIETLDTGAFAGGAARMATTFKGLTSNLEDAWAGFQRQVADAGLFDNVKEGLALTLDGINANTDASKEWAAVISDSLWFAIKGVAYTIAVAATGVQGIRLGFNAVLAPVADLGSAIIEATQPLRDLERRAAAGLGMTGTVDLMDRYDAGLNRASESLAAMRERAMATAEELANAKTPIQTMQDLFAQIEASSKNTADHTRDMSGNAQVAGKGDGGKAEAKAWKDALEAMEKYLDAEKDLQKAEDEANQNTRTNAAQLAILRAKDPRHKIELQAIADIGRVRDAQDAAIADQQANLATMTAAAGSNLDDRLAAEADYQRAVVALNQDAASQIALIDEQKKQAMSAQNAAILSQSVSWATSLADSAATAAGEMYDHQADTANKLREQLAAGDQWYTEAQKAEIRARIKTSEAAARRAFAVEKEARRAGAVVNTAAAVVSALANPPGPPYSIPQAIAAGAAGAVQIGTIGAQQPAFHTGYAPDETATILTSEIKGILTAQGRSAMGGASAVRDANAGVSQGGQGPAYVVQILGHDQQVLKYRKQSVRMGDAYTQKILQARTTLPWRRSRA